MTANDAIAPLMGENRCHQAAFRKFVPLAISCRSSCWPTMPAELATSSDARADSERGRETRQSVRKKILRFVHGRRQR
jgi:hypothetical protein